MLPPSSSSVTLLILPSLRTGWGWGGVSSWWLGPGLLQAAMLSSPAGAAPAADGASQGGRAADGIAAPADDLLALLAWATPLWLARARSLVQAAYGEWPLLS